MRVEVTFPIVGMFLHGDAIWPYSSMVLTQLTEGMSVQHIKMC